MEKGLLVISPISSSSTPVSYRQLLKTLQSGLEYFSQLRLLIQEANNHIIRSYFVKSCHLPQHCLHSPTITINICMIFNTLAYEVYYSKTLNNRTICYQSVVDNSLLYNASKNTAKNTPDRTRGGNSNNLGHNSII